MTMWSYPKQRFPIRASYQPNHRRSYEVLPHREPPAHQARAADLLRERGPGADAGFFTHVVTFALAAASLTRLRAARIPSRAASDSSIIEINSSRPRFFHSVRATATRPSIM